MQRLLILLAATAASAAAVAVAAAATASAIDSAARAEYRVLFAAGVHGAGANL